MKNVRSAREPFAACVARIQAAMAATKTSLEGRLITSRDKGTSKLTDILAVRHMPSGFRKWQLPIYHKGPTHLFVTVAEPGAVVKRHSHEGASTRFIVSGSISMNGQELTAGDWVYIPAGMKYAFSVGPLGAVLQASYEC